MNNKAIKALIESKGIKKRKLAEFLGISPQTLYNKLNGTSDFLISELEMLGDILHLSNEELIEVFFTSRDGKMPTEKGDKT